MDYALNLSVTASLVTQVSDAIKSRQGFQRKRHV